MDEQKVFCVECRKDVSFTTNKKQMQGTIKGEQYTYFGEVAYCDDCDNEIYVNEVNDSNLHALYDRYREKNGLISLETVLEIPKKYAIGKRPLSLLLGWGELTFSRYCDGDLPTRQYSDTLKKIYEDPQSYLELLESNKSNLKSISTYEKSKKAVTALLNADINTSSKIDTAIQYLLHRCEDITPLALQKALYYIQGFYYAFYHSFLFSEECQAWIHGPVYRDVYLRYRDYKFDPIEAREKFDSSVFSTSEKEVLDSVIKNICCYSGKVLENFTHSEEPWLSTRGNLPKNTATDRIINKDCIANYFITVKEKYAMNNPEDIKKYTQELFQDI